MVRGTGTAQVNLVCKPQGIVGGGRIEHQRGRLEGGGTQNQFLSRIVVDRDDPGCAQGAEPAGAPGNLELRAARAKVALEIAAGQFHHGGIDSQCARASRGAGTARKGGGLHEAQGPGADQGHAGVGVGA